MIALIVIVVLLFDASIGVIFLANGQEDFEPITESVALKGIYKLETFISYTLNTVTHLQEEYQYNLGASRIELRRQEFDGTDGSMVVRNYLYDSVNKLDVELDGNGDEEGENLAASRFHLEENGGSSSYHYNYHDHPFTINDPHNNGTSKLGARVLTSSDSLDDIIFKWKSTENNPQAEAYLNLDSFLTRGCARKIQAKLGHIRGLTKLLHLIECRRKEFVSDNVMPHKETRGIGKTIYRATNLPILRDIRSNSLHWLNVTVSVVEDHPATEVEVDSTDSPAVKNNENRFLPKRAQPTSMSLEFGPVSMIINVYQLEASDSGDHLSESGSSESDFMLPLTSGIDLLMRSVQKQPVWMGGGNKHHQQFSFRASLTGSQILLPDPIELMVAYDGLAHKLARQISVIDRGGDSWQKITTRMVYDGESRVKYHLMQSNDDYRQSIDSYTESSSGQSWSECSSDILTDLEAQTLEMAYIESLELEGATYMGMALVRGIPCFVYERPLYRLPFWMGFGLFEFGNLDADYRWSQTHATLYVAAGEMSSQIHRQDERDPGQKVRMTKAKLHRLLITISVPSVNESSPPANYQLIHYNLEIYDFDWSTQLAGEQLPLFDVGQECLYSQPDARYLQMNLKLQPLQPTASAAALLDSLRADDHLRTELISRALSQSLGIAVSQQSDMETSHWLDNTIEVGLNVYQLPLNRILTRFLGHAKDLSVGSAFTGGWSVGVASVTLEECKWRTVHTLRLVTGHSPNFCQIGEGCRSIFMYCPATMHCVISDGSRWDRLESLKSTSTGTIRIESVLQFPASNFDGQSNKNCSLISVELTQQQRTSEAPTVRAGGGVPLDLLIAQKNRLQDTALIHLEDARGRDSVNMKISQLTLSHIAQISESSQGLTGPIPGLAYKHPTSPPLIVPSVAHCSRACFVNHLCESYSICHHPGGQLECLMTKVNWTDPLKVAELREMARSDVRVMRGGEAKKSKFRTVSVQLRDDVEMREIELHLSGVCSIHSNQHVNAFKLDEGPTNVVLISENILRARTSGECARFCLDHANLMASLPSSNEETYRTKQCTSFRYSSQTNLCYLLPDHTFNSSQLPVDPTRSALLNRWRRAHHEALGHESGQTIKNLVAELYEIDYEQLFVVYPDKHLRLLSDGSSQVEMQETFINADFQQCAKFCFRRSLCRSFDLLSQSKVAERHEQDGFNDSAGSRVHTCILNAISLADLNRDGGEKMFALVVEEEEEGKKRIPSNGGDDRWWHYEFDELALYASGKLQLISGNSDDPSDGIFIEPSLHLIKHSSLLPETTIDSTGLLNPLTLWILAIALLTLGLLFFISSRFRGLARNIF